MNIPNLHTVRGTVIAVCAAIVATVLVALAIPPGVSDRDASTDGPGGLPGGVSAPAPEDLGSFVGSERWGISLADILETVAAQDRSRPELNPALRRMGFLGLIETGKAIAVLLAPPKLDGGIIQLAPGDALPDGRILTSVTDNSITLSRGGDHADETVGPTDREVLLLFPRGELDPATATGQ